MVWRNNQQYTFTLPVNASNWQVIWNPFADRQCQCDPYLGHVVLTMLVHSSQSTSVPFCLTLTKIWRQLLPPLDKHHSAQLELLQWCYSCGWCNCWWQLSKFDNFISAANVIIIRNHLLADLHIIVNLPVLDCCAHDWSLTNATLHLSLGRKVDDDRKVDDGDCTEHCQGLTKTQSTTYCPVTLPLILWFCIHWLWFLSFTAPTHHQRQNTVKTPLALINYSLYLTDRLLG